MTDKIAIFVQFGVEMLRVIIGMCSVFGCRLTKKWTLALGYVLLGVILALGENENDSCVFIMWGVVLVLFNVMIKVPDGKSRSRKAYCGLILLCQDEMVSIIITNMMIGRSDMPLIQREALISIVSLTVVVVIGLVYNVVKNKEVMRRIIRYVRRLLVPIIVLIAIEIMLVIEALNSLLPSLIGSPMYVIVEVLCVISMFCVGVLFVTVVYIRRSNEKLEEMLWMERKLKSMEIQHLEALLSKEEETKRYRHDEIQRLALLNGFLKDDEYHAAKEYIQEMLTHIQQIRDSNYETGHKILNIMINYYIQQLDSQVEVTVKGIWNKEPQISDYDISTIVSNLLKNAIEAIGKCNKTSPKLIIEMDLGIMFLRLRIKNSFDETQINYDKEGNPLTTKRNKEKHGIGLKNVRDIVKQNAGSYRCYVEDDMFCSEITLP